MITIFNDAKDNGLTTSDRPEQRKLNFLKLKMKMKILFESYSYFIT